MSRLTVVTAADSAYFPLAKGLLLSLAARAPDPDVAIAFLDIGLDLAQREWIMATGATVIDQRSIDRAVAVRPLYKVQRYMTAQLVRPFLPQLLPEADAIAWLDADVWVQDVSAIAHLKFLTTNHPIGMAIAPLIDVGYWTHYRPQAEMQVPVAGWYRGLFDDKEAEEHGGRCVFSSGVLAAARGSPVWGRWAEALDRAVTRELTDPVLMHLAEQTALNLVLHTDGDFLPLGSWFNYNCHLGPVLRRPEDGRIVRGLPPFEALGIIHLSDFRLRGASYLEQGLLFDGGTYLDATDRAILDGLTPHL